MFPRPPVAGLFRHRFRAGIVGVAEYFVVFAPVGYQTELRLEILRPATLLRKDGCFYPTPRKGKISRKQLILSAVALPPCLENFPGAAVPDKAACLALRARQGTRISHRLIPLTGSSPLTLKAKGKLPRKTGLNRAVQIQRKPALNLTISASYESFYPFVQTHL